ncbi:MAG: helix-turn-helix domain-containing protein, partial [Candidatus Binatia bacterium]
MAGPKRGPGSIDDAVLDEVRAERIDTLSGPDSPEGRELGAAVGANLARLRALRSLDPATLAVRSGIREELLRALEAGDAVPSLRAIWHLATALEVPFGSLLANTQLTAGGDPDFRVQPAARGRVIASATNEFRSRVLFLEGDPRTPEVYELTLAPGCFEQATPHAHDTYEHIVVVRGTMIVRSGEAQARLGPGDSIFFRADTPHSYENPGAEAVAAHLVMT